MITLNDICERLRKWATSGGVTHPTINDCIRQLKELHQDQSKHGEGTPKLPQPEGIWFLYIKDEYKWMEFDSRTQHLPLGEEGIGHYFGPIPFDVWDAVVKNPKPVEEKKLSLLEQYEALDLTGPEDGKQYQAFVRNLISEVETLKEKLND